MGRKCSHCGNTGHNSRTCNNSSKVGPNNNINNNNIGGGVRLFGVQLDVSMSNCISSSSSIHMKKSFSLDCLSISTVPVSSSSPSSSLSSSRIPIGEIISDKASIGYLSDGPLGRVPERKKGVPWTEEEHRTFLIGLEKLGKGDWRGISRNFVTSRTPTQVASHAQKYFLRQASLNKKKRRSSLFDMVGASNCNDGLENVSKREVLMDLQNCSIFGDDQKKSSLNQYCEENMEMGSKQDFNICGYDESPNFQMCYTPADSPELDLTLSGPKIMMAQNNDQSSTTKPLLMGPISVT